MVDTVETDVTMTGVVCAERSACMHAYCFEHVSGVRGVWWYWCGTVVVVVVVWARRLGGGWSGMGCWCGLWVVGLVYEAWMLVER